MKTLDQRILIQARPEQAWAHISDISRNPEWQADCASISFLTSVRKGPGVRWRYTAPSGHDYVVETTLWYDRVGYEYTFIDGAPFKKSQGIIRLQDTPDGTVIQWIFSYELGGPLGNLRDTLSTRRHLENTMVESLYALYQLIKGDEGGSFRSETLMRDAPAVEERATYKPRHPSLFEQIAKSIPGGITGIDEPPISDEDTRPRLSVAAESAPADESVVEVEAVTGLEPERTTETIPQTPTADETATEILPVPETTTSADVTEGSRKEADDAAFKRPAEETAVKEAPPESPPRDEAPSDTVPTVPEAEETASAAPSDTATETRSEIVPEVTQPAEPAKKSEKENVATQEAAFKSVFEIFGLPKPSESQEMAPVHTAEAAPEHVLTSGGLPMPGRFGLRIALRRRLVKLRRP